jgi:hypothetical protein
MVKREWQMDEDFIAQVIRYVIFLDYVINVLRKITISVHSGTTMWVSHTVTAEQTKRAKMKALKGNQLALLSRGTNARAYLRHNDGSPKHAHRWRSERPAKGNARKCHQ